MLRSWPVTGVVLVACLVATNAVLAQNPAVTCESLLQPGRDKSDRTFLGLKDCYNCHTNGFPADGFGARFGIMANDSWILANEFKTWGDKDKHAQAYTSLLSDAGTKIGVALGIGENSHRDKRCLACHTGFPISEMETDDRGLISEDKYKEDIRLTTGVSCEGCHGKAGGTHGWLAAHANKEKWRFLEPEIKCESGFYNLRSVISRTRLCLSCHLGNAGLGRILTHEMYAAGHPPLPAFEIETFQNQMPRHWRHLSEKAGLQDEFQEKTGVKSDPDQLERTKSLLIAALIARSESLRLTADLAEGTSSEHVSRPQWPEFSQFDCYACHHDLRNESWRQAAQHAGVPGRPVLLPWPTALSRLASTLVAAPDGVKPNNSGVQTAILRSPFGDRIALIKAARLSADRTDQLAEVVNRQKITISEGNALLERIVEVAATEVFDYESARQLVWAFDVIQQELRSHREIGIANSLQNETLTDVREMFVLSLKDGRLTKHLIPTATQERSVIEVDLKTVLPPIASYNAIAFRKAFAEVRHRHQSSSSPTQ